MTKEKDIPIEQFDDDFTANVFLSVCTFLFTVALFVMAAL